MKSWASLITLVLFFQASHVTAESFEELKEAFVKSPIATSFTLQRMLKAGLVLHCRSWTDPTKKLPEVVQNELFGKDPVSVERRLSVEYGVPKFGNDLLAVDHTGQLISLRAPTRGVGTHKIVNYFKETESSILVAMLSDVLFNTEPKTREVHGYLICDLPK